jgi:preprotein translocase subunit YajC
MSYACLLQAATPESPFGPQFWLMMGVVFIGYYFFILRPMSRQRKKQDDMQQSLKSGDRILTTGGLYATVAKVRDDRLIVRIADGVQVELARTAIASVVTTTGGE